MEVHFKQCARKFYKESMIRNELPERFVKLCDDFIREIESEVGGGGLAGELMEFDASNRLK